MGDYYLVYVFAKGYKKIYMGCLTDHIGTQKFEHGLYGDFTIMEGDGNEYWKWDGTWSSNTHEFFKMTDDDVIKHILLETI